MAISLGSNLGDRREHLQFGFRRVREIAEGVKCSAVYATSPMYVETQPDFLNACCVGRTRLTPLQLLAHLKDAERAAGRERVGRRFGARALDLDLLLYEDRRIRMPGLIVPHPRLRERPFVLVPLAEIAPDWVVPGSPGGPESATVAALAAAVGSGGILGVIEE